MTLKNTLHPISHIILRGKKYEKLKWTEDSQPCPDCGTVIGSYHDESCDLERCPRCKEQFIGCGCVMSVEAWEKLLKESDEWLKTCEKGKKYKVVKSKSQLKTVKKYDLLTGWGTVLEINKSEKEIKEIFIDKKNMSAEIIFDDFSKHLV